MSWEEFVTHFVAFGGNTCSGGGDSPSASRFRFPELLHVGIMGEVDAELLCDTTREMNCIKTAPGGRTACT